MTHGSLFSGIGGFDLAAEWMGWENVFHCEFNPFGQFILKYYWPKQLVMQTSQKQTSLFTEEQLTYLPEGSHANHSVQPANKAGIAMSDIYGPKCLEQYERLNPNGLWAKTFVALLQENLQGCSKKYAHRWRLLGTRYNRVLFQLRRLVPNTKGKEFGLLPTPNASDFRDRGHYWDPCNQRRLEIGKQVGLSTLFKGTPCPSCVIHIMGFPENWLSKPFMQEETQ